MIVSLILFSAMWTDITIYLLYSFSQPTGVPLLTSTTMIIDRLYL